MSGEFFGATLLKLVIAAPIVHFLMKRDRANHANRALVSRWYFQLASLITMMLIAHPFVDKPVNYFERFNTIVLADPSTLYQQFTRTQLWIDDMEAQEVITAEEAKRRKTENERIHKRVHPIGNKRLYIKFGDIIDYEQTGSIEEPSFLYVSALSGNFVAWFMGAVLLTCYHLPAGGLLSVLLLLISFFALEMEARYISTETLFGYMIFITDSEWTVFEAINALKQAMPGFVCMVIVINALFSGSGDTMKTMLRNLLRTNAGIVTVLKDENLKQASIDPDEPVSAPGMNLPTLLARGIGALVLLNSVLFISSSD
jgi:hypothetical protein